MPLKKELKKMYSSKKFAMLQEPLPNSTQRNENEREAKSDSGTEMGIIEKWAKKGERVYQNAWCENEKAWNWQKLQEPKTLLNKS